MTKPKKGVEEKVVDQKEPSFTKEQLINSRKYSQHKDALNVVLQVDKSYTFSEVDEALKKFMKGKVKE